MVLLPPTLEHTVPTAIGLTNAYSSFAPGYVTHKPLLPAW